MSDVRSVVLTCAQPTGSLHLGNYFGAIRKWVSLPEVYDCFFGIVDLHGVTVSYTPSELRRHTLECAAQYLACGLDPAECQIFVQSQVIGHTELAWILGCLAPLGRLERMTQFKDKARGERASVGSGLLTYPVLMAADILLYNADVVPVGEDQKQHMELARDLAQKFNTTYSPTFKLPEPLIAATGARIRSLQAPEKKMSKSDSQHNGVVFLVDAPEVIRKKLLSAVTDSGSEIRASEDKPGITNLLNIFSAASGRTVSELEAEYSSSSGYAAFKAAVADAVIALLDPVRERYKTLIKDKGYLKNVLKEGAEVAQRRASRMLGKVYKKCGFLLP